MFRFRDDVGNQSPFTGPVFPNDHDGTIHKRMSSQGSLDLTQFNAEAPNFYLVVAASEELDVSIRKIARHVTSAIHPGAGVTHEGIGNKTFICARGLLQVSCGDSITRNVELSYNLGVRVSPPVIRYLRGRICCASVVCNKACKCEGTILRTSSGYWPL